MLTLLQVLSDKGGEIHRRYLLSHWMAIPENQAKPGFGGFNAHTPSGSLRQGRRNPSTLPLIPLDGNTRKSGKAWVWWSLMLTLLQVLSDNGGEIHLLYLLSHWMEIPKIRQSLGLVGLKFTRFQVLSDNGGEKLDLKTRGNIQ